jgi:flagellar biosynthesis protein FlhG
LEEVVIKGPSGVQVIPAASGIQQMAELSEAEHIGLIRAFSDLSLDLDVLIVDTAAGISDTVISFSRAVHELVVVVCDEPASITDAYALIKLMHREYGVSRFRILANMTRSAKDGRELYNKMCRVTDRYLDVILSFVGSIPYDDSLRKAVRNQKPVIQAFPRSQAAQAFKNLAKKADNWPVPEGASGHLQFFVERLVRYASHGEGVGQ